jgi:ubiquinone/menaquinone biosynthesis C-methylase UbiE
VSDRPSPELADEILEHYRRFDEAGRLSSGDGLLELLRTRELIQRHVGPEPSTIVDVGGGPGVYTVWLAGLGHHVHLVEPVPEHVEQAAEAARAAGVELAGAHVGDGRALPLAADSADAVLVMGPLYHLQAAADRMQVLNEAQRVLRPGGLVFGAAISRFASSIDGLWSGFIDDPTFRAMVERVLESGRHLNPTGNMDYFTTAFFHRPSELHAEVRAAAFSDVTVYPVEGVGWAARDLDERLRDPERRRRLLALIRALEGEPSLLGASPHLLAVGRRT